MELSGIIVCPEAMPTSGGKGMAVVTGLCEDMCPAAEQARQRATGKGVVLGQPGQGAQGCRFAAVKAFSRNPDLSPGEHKLCSVLLTVLPVLHDAGGLNEKKGVGLVGGEGGEGWGT